MKQKWRFISFFLFFLSLTSPQDLKSQDILPDTIQSWPLQALNEVTASGFPGRKFTGRAIGGVLSFLKRRRSCKRNLDASCKGRNSTL